MRSWSKERLTQENSKSVIQRSPLRVQSEGRIPLLSTAWSIHLQPHFLISGIRACLLVRSVGSQWSEIAAIAEGTSSRRLSVTPSNLITWRRNVRSAIHWSESANSYTECLRKNLIPPSTFLGAAATRRTCQIFVVSSAPLTFTRMGIKSTTGSFLMGQEWIFSVNHANGGFLQLMRLTGMNVMFRNAINVIESRELSSPAVRIIDFLSISSHLGYL